MSVKNILIIILVAVYCLQLTACGLLNKPKQWLDREEDPRAPTKLTSLETETVQGQLVWRNSVGNLGGTYTKIRPYITEDRVYLNDAEGRVEAWQRTDGKRLWTVSLKEQVSGGVNGGEDIVVLGTRNGSVIALDAAGGKEKWRTSVTSEVMTLSEVKHGVIVVRSNDNKVHALDIDTGKLAWRKSRNTPPLTLRGASEPKVVGDSVLVGYDDGKMMALSLHDGAELWEVTVSVARGRSELERISDIDGEIAYFDGVVYAVSFNGRVVAVNMDTGSVIWAKEFSSSAGLSADEKHVYITDADSSLWTLDRASGVTLWRQDKLLYRKLTAPRVMGNYVIAGDYKGYLHWLSIKDGKLVGRNNVSGDAVNVAPTVINGHAYVLTDNGSLAVFSIMEKG